MAATSLAAVRDGLKTRLATISGLRTHDTIPDTVNVPAAVVSPVEVEYDAVMGGCDTFRFNVLLLVSRASERAGQDKLDGYVASTGSGSVKAAVEGGQTLGGIVGDTVVRSMQNYGATYEVAGVSYIGCEFTVEVLANAS